MLAREVAESPATIYLLTPNIVSMLNHFSPQGT